MRQALTICAIFFVSSTLYAQVIAPAEWADVPFAANGKDPYQVLGPYCQDGNGFALAEMKPAAREHIGYVFPDQGTAFTKPVVLPNGNHYNLNGFNVIGGRPCVVFDVWDKKTNDVTFKVQRYTASFDPDGEPIVLGKVSFGRSGYGGTALSVKVLTSEDASKALFLYDGGSSSGVQIAFCWVTNADLALLWKGVYRIPVDAESSATTPRILNNGHVFLQVTGAVLRDDQKSAAGILRQYRKRTINWYHMYGEVFSKWDCSVAGIPYAEFGEPVVVGARMVFGGAIPGEIDGGTSEWVLVELSATLEPTVLGKGTFRTPGLTAPRKVTALTDNRGNVYLQGFNHDQAFIAKFSPSFQLGEERFMLMGEPRNTHWVGDRIYVGDFQKAKDVKRKLAGVTYEPDLGLGSDYIPFVLAADPDGTEKVYRLLPEDVDAGRSVLYGALDFSSISRCGCYMDRSYDKKHPGLVRVRLPN